MHSGTTPSTTPATKRASAHCAQVTLAPLVIGRGSPVAAEFVARAVSKPSSSALQTETSVAACTTYTSSTPTSWRRSDRRPQHEADPIQPHNLAEAGRWTEGGVLYRDPGPGHADRAGRAHRPRYCGQADRIPATTDRRSHP